MPHNVYLDESIRSSYFLCAVVISSSETARLRAHLKKLRTAGQTAIHMQTETTARQAQIADSLHDVPCKALIIDVAMPRRADLAARKQALEQACSHTFLQDAQLITLDSSNSITQDRQTIAQATTVKNLNFPHYRHMNSRHEPLLWLPDIIAWCYGRGGTWRDAVEPLVTEVIELYSSYAGSTKPKYSASIRILDGFSRRVWRIPCSEVRIPDQKYPGCQYMGAPGIFRQTVNSPPMRS